MRRVDPLGVTLRWARSVHRRSYSVPCPNSLWHIDSNHALIRWKLYVHGGIDGYSRLIVFLKCATNIRADTIFDSFTTACNRIGIPSRVRSDRGTENLLVATFMILYRGAGRASHITGTSVHNQRVERLWRDVYIASTSLFYQLFYMLEEVGLLDPENEIHLYALHYVYLPRINQSLQLFCNSWNQHPLTSCNCRTPQQLWLRGMLQNIHSGYTAVDSLSSSIVLPTPTPTESDVETSSDWLSSHDVENLRSTIEPLRHSDCWGVDIYLDTVSFIIESI